LQRWTGGEGRGGDGLEHVGGRGLLLERFPQLIEEARVLDRDDGLLGEARHQRDLLVGERAHLLTVEIDGSDQLISFEHWDRDHRPISSQLGSGDDGWNALNVWPRRRDVGDLRDLFRAGNSPKGWVGERIEYWFPFAGLDICGRGVVKRCGVKTVAIIRVEGAELRLAEARRVRQHRLENGLQLARRARDGPQNLAGRRLLLQRL